MRKKWLETVQKLAIKNERIVFIGSDLSADPALKRFQKEIPDRFFMEGVSEAHIVGMASGLATSGRIAYVNTIATFLTRRCFEQNVIDLGLANANVRLIGGGGGLVYAPLGPTHLAIDDIAIMRAIPNMAIIAPADADEMERTILATENHQGPVYIRQAKGGEPIVSRAEHGFEIGKVIVHREPKDVLLITTGTQLSTALRVSDDLKVSGIEVGVAHAHTVKPLDTSRILELIRKSRVVLTLEEHIINGGLGSAVAELIAENSFDRRIVFKRMGLPDIFPDEYGSQDSLLEKYGLNSKHIISRVQEMLASGRGL